MTFGRLRIAITALVGLSVLGACSGNDQRLQGERLDIRGQSTAAVVDRALPINLPASVLNSDWTHRASNARHLMGNARIAANPSIAWTNDIGQGNSRKHRITAAPVSDGPRIFTLDAGSTVVATSTAGATLWSLELTPASDKQAEASGGSLAVVNGTLYAATGFGTLHALDAQTGNVLWKQKLDAGISGAPVISGGQVYLTTQDSRGWVLDAENGRLQWQVNGAPSAAGVTGGAGPAIGNTFAIFPFGSGQVSAAYKREGFEAWESSITGGRLGRAYARIADITGDPVIFGSRVYLGNPGGRLVALDMETGDRLWTAEQGALGPVAVAGGSVFSVTDEAELVRLNASNGQHIWASDLPGFVPVRRERRQRDIYPNYGPLLAGGLLWVASGDGAIRAFDPVNGLQVRQVDLGSGAASAPIAVGGAIYVVTIDGDLVALR